MQWIIGLVLALIALVAVSPAQAIPQNRYIEHEHLDAEALQKVITIALLEMPKPEAYCYGGGKPGWKSMTLGVIGTIAEVNEMGKNADQYRGTDFT